MHRSFLITALALGGLAVILGAFGAHGLKQYLGPESVNSFDTGVRYQFYHVFALLFTGILFERFPFRAVRWAGYSFIMGILLFSGSLYLITALKVSGTVGLSGIGIITPFGGVFFIVGWLLLISAVISGTKK